jgi:hypothetical protein
MVSVKTANILQFTMGFQENAKVVNHLYIGIQAKTFAKPARTELTLYKV